MAVNGKAFSPMVRIEAQPCLKNHAYLLIYCQYGCTLDKMNATLVLTSPLLIGPVLIYSISGNFVSSYHYWVHWWWSVEDLFKKFFPSSKPAGDVSDDVTALVVDSSVLAGSLIAEGLCYLI